MKTLLTKLSLLSLLLMMGLASCTEEDGTGTGNGDTNSVTGLSANARSATEVNVRWTGGSATDTLVATLNGTEMKYTAVTTETIDGTVYYKAVATGLTLNNNYAFNVRNSAGTSAGSITWAPATRWPGASTSTQIWSTADPSPAHPSGLIIDASGITPMSVNDAARKAEIDVVLAANDLTQMPGIPVSILSPGINGSGIITDKRTFFGTPYNVAGGLDNDYYTAPITTLISTTGANAFNAVDLSTRTDAAVLGTSLIIPFLTDDGHYGRIELMPGSTGQVYTTAGGIESVQVRVSYQTQANNGYVARGTVRNGSTVRNAVGMTGTALKH
jgi:hypothetical protein